MNKSLKIIIIVVVSFVTLALILKSTGVIGSKKTMLKVKTEKAKLTDIIETVTASGKIQPETEIKISGLIICKTYSGNPG